MHHRPEHADGTETPADICDTCSDVEAGRLVPTAFCPTATAHLAAEAAFLDGTGSKPMWLVRRDLRAYLADHVEVALNPVGARDALVAVLDLCDEVRRASTAGRGHSLGVVALTTDVQRVVAAALGLWYP